MAVLTLDGSHGEGGGQILRTALSLSVTTGCPFRLVNIRARRPKPGLRPQHLSAVRAAAAICGAEVSGDRLDSTELDFAPGHGPSSGSYIFDVASVAEGGSAGSASLLLQTLLVPLALAGARSTLVLRGGTHVQWAPSFDHLARSYLPALRSMGIHAEADLRRWGWYPVGRGEIACSIGVGRDEAAEAYLKAITVNVRAPLRRIVGRAVASNLPAHIPQRMAARANALLCGLGVPVLIEPQLVPADCSGTGIFLSAEYGELAAGFSAYGRRGIPSEAVAEEAVEALHEHHASNATIELHLADQILLPLALASDVSTFTVARSTKHLQTNGWTIGQFGIAKVSIEEGAPCSVRIEPRGRHLPLERQWR